MYPIARLKNKMALKMPIYSFKKNANIVTNLEYQNYVHRGSYMSAHVLLNLLNELGKTDKMRGLPSILSIFRSEVNKFNNTRARMLDSIYHMTNTLKFHFWRKKRYDFVMMCATLLWTS